MRKPRKALSAAGLLSKIRASFNRIVDHRKGKVSISLADALMSGLAVLGLKSPPLLAFDRRRQGLSTI